MKIKAFNVTIDEEIFHYTNCYLVQDYRKAHKTAIIVDPGGDVSEILSYLTEHDVILQAVLLTHGHIDHIYGIKQVLDYKFVPIYMHKSEEQFLYNTKLNLDYMFGKPVPKLTNLDIKYVVESQILNILNSEIVVMETPGHTIGGLSYHIPKIKSVLTGDTLFNNGVGRTDLPTGNNKILHNSLGKLLKLSNETTVYPGHGPVSTIAKERKNLTFKKAKN